jgi:hypothetical protein
LVGASAFKVLLIINGAWCVNSAGHDRKIQSKFQIPLSDRQSRILAPANDVSVRFKNRNRDIALDGNARVIVSGNPEKALLVSEKLATELLAWNRDRGLIFILLEQVGEVLRATVHFSEMATLEQLALDRPELRLAAFDLPPGSVTEIEPSFTRDGMDADSIYEVLLSKIQTEDPELFSVHTEKFLKAPHIVVPLLSHLASLGAEDNLRFPVQLRKLSDQFRTILEHSDSPISIQKVKHDHLSAWADAQGRRFAFIDGGVAKIAGLPGTEPTALRVGIYCVRPGDTSLSSREQWELQPFVVGDIIDKNTGVHMEDDEQIDLRRLGEAARYTLEPLTGLRFVEANPDVNTVFLHGPLINQFVMYDEDEPHFIPYLREDFLNSVGIDEKSVSGALRDIPKARDGKSRMWRQFMAIYGIISQRVFANSIPFVGVVERSAGTWLAQAVLDHAVAARIVMADYKRKVLALLKRYNISDDFLFGCVLAEAEYISPTIIPKNEIRRAREIWKPVVGQYPRPFATLLKTTETSFPFRVEMNNAGKVREQDVMRTLYHTARLLPRYAFPVGLDIVDKYAKVPDWLSRNISARVAAKVLNRTIAEGDARLVTQVRRLLAHTPRDFFYRPQS